MNTDVSQLTEPQPALTVQVPNAGMLMMYSSTLAATTLATLYNEREMRRRPQMRSPNSHLFPLTGRNIVNGINALVGGLAVANGAVAMRQRVPGRGRPVSFMFKNDAEIILQPYRVDTPSSLLYNTSLSTTLPNECAVCTMHQASGFPTTGQASFRFAVISTDPLLTSNTNLPIIDLEVQMQFTSEENRVGWIGINGVRAPRMPGRGLLNLYLFRATAPGFASFALADVPSNPGGIDSPLGSVIVFAPVLR